MLRRELVIMAGGKEPEDHETKPTDTVNGVQGKGVLLALKGGKTLAELAQQFDAHPGQIPDWKKPLQERIADWSTRARRPRCAVNRR